MRRTEIRQWSRIGSMSVCPNRWLNSLRTWLVRPDSMKRPAIIRDLIRRDMEQRGAWAVRESILAGYRDLAAGAVFDSTGDFAAEMAKLEEMDRRLSEEQASQ